jgi:SAM-dependent methyltransferase
MTRAGISGFIALLLCLASAGEAQAQTAPPQHMNQPGYHHSFGDADRWAKEFDDPARDAWQKPDEILDALRLARTDRVADIGAGTGYFSARIAKRVPDGKLFAVDIEPDMLRYLGERAHHEHLHALQTVQASQDSPNLPEPVDVALLVDTYHHIDDRVAYFSRLKSSLRAGGRVAIVDFKMDAPEGPPRAQRISPDKVRAELEQTGYSLAASHDFLSRQYFLVFVVR